VRTPVDWFYTRPTPLHRHVLPAICNGSQQHPAAGKTNSDCILNVKPFLHDPVALWAHNRLARHNTDANHLAAVENPPTRCTSTQPDQCTTIPIVVDDTPCFHVRSDAGARAFRWLKSFPQQLPLLHWRVSADSPLIFGSHQDLQQAQRKPWKQLEMRTELAATATVQTVRSKV
jgi:hypothetical protein